MYIYIYVSLHLPCCVPPLKHRRIFFHREPPKKLLMGGPLGEIYGEGYMEELMIRSSQWTRELHKCISQ